MRIYLMIILFVAIAAAVSAQDFDQGFAAYKSGDYSSALKEWKPLAEQGYAEAQSNLGVMHTWGAGVPHDHQAAVKWFRLAAEQKHPDAHGNVG